MIKLEVNNKVELLAIHRAIYEAKFNPEPYWFPEGQGSPFVARFANQVLDALIEHEEDEEQVQRWEAWRQADQGRSEYQLLLKQIQDGDWWEAASSEKRKRIYRTLHGSAYSG